MDAGITGVLSGTFFLSVPLNAGAIIIFLRRKKLRHLVNFLLLLDSTSHLLVTFLILPTRVISTAWIDEFEPVSPTEYLIGGFANIHGTLLTLSIAILRYRRLCWKKKDGLNLLSGLKWSLFSGLLALLVSLAPFTLPLLFDQTEDERNRLNLVVYSFKVGTSISSLFGVSWCYACVCCRILQNPTNHDKLQRSRRVRWRATVHSVIQVLLLAATVASFLYVETIELHFPASANQNLGYICGSAINYGLLVTGTPLAYLASCHRFREQFTSLFFRNFQRTFLQKISARETTIQTYGPKLHLIAAENNRLRHKVIQTPSTLRTMTSSSTSSSGGAGNLKKKKCHLLKPEFENSIATLSRFPFESSRTTIQVRKYDPHA